MNNQHHQQYKLHEQQQLKQMKMQQVPLAHNGQNNHNRRRCSKVPVRELPEAMPEFQHPIYPQLYTVEEPQETCYKWDCIILDLDRTIIHGKRLSVKRWRKYVENGTIPSLAENQCSKWHRHIHRKGHQMHPFIRGRTMIYYRPFTWHLLAVLDYLKSHFGTKIIVCTKAGEHYAASVLAALISNFTSANPDLIDDVYNFHDLHDDAEEEGKPKKPFRLICNRHDLDPKKTLIVDDNATSWFGADRKITNFWMPPCYGYQIHDIDNELQLLCKYLWDPIQQNHLKKKKQSAVPVAVKIKIDDKTKRYQEEEALSVKHIQHHSQGSDTTDSSISPNSSPKREIISRQSPKSISSNTLSPKNQRYLTSPNSKSSKSNNGNSPKNVNELQYYQQSVSSAFSIATSEPDRERYNKQNEKQSFNQSLDDDDEQKMNITSIARISRNYNKRKYKEQQINGAEIAIDEQTKRNTKSSSSPKSAPKQTKTKKKGYFFESKSRGSKKLAKIIGK